MKPRSWPTIQTCDATISAPASLSRPTESGASLAPLDGAAVAHPHPPRRYVAFLRGIGPPKKAPGEELRRCFRRAGYDGVVPVLATGNVIFALGPKMKEPKAPDIEAMLAAHFGYPIPVVLRRADAIAAMFARDPFRDIDLAAETRFVCMLGEGARRSATLPKPPPGAGFRFVGRMDDNLFLARDNDAAGTPEMMAFLDKTFGPAITTRNWNTMEKVAARLAAE